MSILPERPLAQEPLGINTYPWLGVVGSLAPCRWLARVSVQCNPFAAGHLSCLGSKEAGLIPLEPPLLSCVLLCCGMALRLP